MRKLFLILSYSLFHCIVSGQVTIPELENTSDDTVFSNDPSIRLLREKSEIIIMYRIVNYTTQNGNENADFKVISMQPDGKWNYYVLK